jgi:hypothetical protein
MKFVIRQSGIHDPCAMLCTPDFWNNSIKNASHGRLPWLAQYSEFGGWAGKAILASGSSGLAGKQQAAISPSIKTKATGSLCAPVAE